MTPEQLRTLADMEDRLDAVTHAEQDACDAAENDIAAMRTPITAEALIADGWVLIDNRVYSLNDSYLSMYVHLFSDGPVVTYRCRRLPAVSTMYDLRELIRLLGAQP